MTSVVIILTLCGLAVVHATSLNALESKGDQKGFDFQSTLPSIKESTTGNIHPENFAPLRRKIAKEDKTISNDNKMSRPFLSQEDQTPIFLHDSGAEQNAFQSGHPATPFPSSFDNGQPIFPGQFYSSGNSQHAQEQMYDNPQNEYQQQSFYGDNQNAPRSRQHFGSQELPSDYGNNQETVQREFFDDQHLAPGQQTLYSGVPSKESPEQALNSQQQPTGEQYFFSSGIHVGDHRGKSIHASHLKSQVYSDKQLVSLQTQGLSAFNTRKQPLLFPSSSLHSSSMMVAGLNHLPLLPALVYNSNTVPSSHAVAISKGAAVRQHLQTPYVRYVYSHLL